MYLTVVRALQNAVVVSRFRTGLRRNSDTSIVEFENAE
jgi:hypothetical protein